MQEHYPDSVSTCCTKEQPSKTYQTKPKLKVTVSNKKTNKTLIT
jgi:hypothetical protein